MAIRTVIAEDNLLVRAGLTRLLETQADIDVVAACGDLAALLATVDAESPDVVVTDICRRPTSCETRIPGRAWSCSASTPSRDTRSRCSSGALPGAPISSRSGSRTS